MELEQLRAGWDTLNNRLKENEIVNLNIVREMIAQKTRTAFDGVCRHNYYNLGVCLLIICVVFPYVYMNTPIRTLSFVVVEAAMVIGLAPLIWKLFLLSQFNLEGKRCSELMRLVLRYKKACHQESIWTIAEVAVAMVAFYVSELMFNDQANYAFGVKVLLPLGLSLMTFALGFALALWQRRRHAMQLKEIETGLKELKEFDY